MPGPPPLPTEMKKLRGTHRPHRDGPEDHPFDDLPAENVVMPDDVTGEAAEIWNAIVPSLVTCDVVREVDVPYVAGMCRWYAEFRRLERRLASFAPLTLNDEKHAALLQRRMSDAWRNFSSSAARLGLTPSDRARIRAGKDTPGGKSAGGNSDPLSYLGISRN